MDTTITTIMFDGQFWIAVVERISESSIYTAKYTFGPEPGDTDLLDFYLNSYDGLCFFRGKHEYRIKKKYSGRELERMSCKSHDIYKAAQKEYLEEFRHRKTAERRLEADKRYKQKQRKKKEKKRGH